MSDVKKTHIHLLSPGPDYDPAYHITLDELREMGATNLPLEQDIPGCAWIPRGAMVPGTVEAQPFDPDNPQKMKVTMKMGFAEAFVWETTTVVVDGDVDLEELQRTLDGAEESS